jgi:hypothetical protein
MKQSSKARYNDDWLATASDIRLRRAKNRCEKCALPYGLIVRKQRGKQAVPASPAELEQLEALKTEGMLKHWQRLKLLGLKQVVLSVAHLNHSEKDDRPENLLCLCQWCHLEYDRTDNAIRRYAGYYRNTIPLSTTM